MPSSDSGDADTQFTCFTSTKVQILTPATPAVLAALLRGITALLRALQRGRVAPGRTLRFLVHVVKVYLVPNLVEQQQPPPPQQQQVKRLYVCVYVCDTYALIEP